ncbi:hypothetical protein [Rhodococcus sp. OK519]|uniref:hypothetical protein n=1 Tax=Rhodococcus sp. OK519 TaxID=2135729 RepID=UPI002158BC17
MPLRTFTSALGHGDVVRVPPSEAYLETMATGLGEVFGWNSERAQAYLRGL